MKSILFSLSFLSLINIAQAGDKPQPAFGDISVNIPGNPTTIYFDGNPAVSGQKSEDGNQKDIVVTFHYSAESADKLKGYQDKHFLSPEKGENGFKVVEKFHGIMDSKRCDKEVVNGSIRKIKGVCFEGVTVTTPSALNPTVLDDGVTVSVTN